MFAYLREFLTKRAFSAAARIVPERHHTDANAVNHLGVDTAHFAELGKSLQIRTRRDTGAGRCMKRSTMTSAEVAGDEGEKHSGSSNDSRGCKDAIWIT